MGTNKRLQTYNLISGQTHSLEENNIIRGDIVDRSNTLEFHKSSGDVIYIDKSGEEHKGHFGLRDNGYMLLSFLMQHPGGTFTADEIVLNKKREGTSESTPDRRVRDTIQTVRKGLGLIKDKANDLFIVEKGFGLSCKVEIKP